MQTKGDERKWAIKAGDECEHNSMRYPDLSLDKSGFFLRQIFSLLRKCATEIHMGVL